MKLLRDVAKKRTTPMSTTRTTRNLEMCSECRWFSRDGDEVRHQPWCTRYLDTQGWVQPQPPRDTDGVLYTGPRPYTNVTLGRQTIDIPIRLEPYSCPSCRYITVGYAGNMPIANHSVWCRLLEQMEGEPF
jgi:hypothetical protein